MLESPLLSGSSFLLLRISTWKRLIVMLSLVSLMTACAQIPEIDPLAPLNSGYAEQQPALSGDGRYLGFVSDRQGRQKIYVYDRQQHQFLALPGLNQPRTVMAHPSLSTTGRYIVYGADSQNQPQIYLYDRATQQSQSLTRSYLGPVRNPRISPDGRYVVFEGAQAGRWDVEVLDRGTRIELDTLEDPIGKEEKQ